MAVLTVVDNRGRHELPFTPPVLLGELLRNAGFALDHPCGGRGVCGKCAAEVTGEVSPPDEAERRLGKRLTCRTILLGDAVVRPAEKRAMEQIELGREMPLPSLDPMEGRLGAAVDVGTTTIAVKLYDLHSGKCLAEYTCENPQRAVAADVMGRISSALSGGGERLKELIGGALVSALESVCADAGRPDALVVTGNTTMLYLLTGHSPESLARAPFLADRLFDEETELFGINTYLPPCMGAFVGADITCAVLASGMCEKDETALLCDIGTNGEIALWKNGTLYAASTAAGPAFEGAGISCGCGSVQGAVDKVWCEGDKLGYHTIGSEEPVGLCGSGLIDAAAALLDTGELDETGAIENDAVQIAPGVSLSRADIRALQLAKAAIAAGTETVLLASGTELSEIGTLYIAGGFGSHLNVKSAVRIGLIPAELETRVQVIGNAALAGASGLLLCRALTEKAREIAHCVRHIELGGNKVFSESFVERLFFPEA